MKTALLIALLLASNSFAQQKEQPQPGRYQIISAEDVAFKRTFLLDTWTGKTWRFDASTWVPINRLETPEQVKAFVAQRSKETAKREQMQKDMGSR